MTMRSYHGTYEVKGTDVIESSDLKIITRMLEHDLSRIDSSPKTWETLYYLESENSYWLLSYDEPEKQGGGIKVLNEISEEAAKAFREGLNKG